MSRNIEAEEHREGRDGKLKLNMSDQVFSFAHVFWGAAVQSKDRLISAFWRGFANIIARVYQT